MKKLIFFCLLIFISPFTFAQDIFIDKTGQASFFSEAPLENIDATSNEVMSALNIKTKKIVFNIPIRSFHFKKKLMEEHFNEKYLESEKYPKATFDGSITNLVDLTKNGIYEVMIEGDLNIHGVTVHRKEKAFLTVKEGKINGKSEFTVKIADHKIEIPKLVIKNIAEEVLVKITVNYELKK